MRYFVMALLYPAMPPTLNTPIIAKTPNISIIERPDCVFFVTIASVAWQSTFSKSKFCIILYPLFWLLFKIKKLTAK